MSLFPADFLELEDDARERVIVRLSGLFVEPDSELFTALSAVDGDALDKGEIIKQLNASASIESQNLLQIAFGFSNCRDFLEISDLHSRRNHIGLKLAAVFVLIYYLDVQVAASGTSEEFGDYSRSSFNLSIDAQAKAEIIFRNPKHDMERIGMLVSERLAELVLQQRRLTEMSDPADAGLSERRENTQESRRFGVATSQGEGE